jgi:hypothetical protein
MAIDLRQYTERTINQRWVPLNYSIAANQQYMPVDGELVVVTNTPAFRDRRILLLGTLYDSTRNKTVAELYADFLLTPTAAEVMAALQGETQMRVQADASLQAQINAVKQGVNVALPFQNLNDFNAWVNNGTRPPFWAQIVPPLTWAPADARVGWLALFIDTGINDKWYTGTEWVDTEITIDLSGYLTTEEAAQVYAPIESPAFTGLPTAPIPDLETAPDNQIEVVRNSRMIYNLIKSLGTGIFIRADDDDDDIFSEMISDDDDIQIKQDETEVG